MIIGFFCIAYYMIICIYLGRFNSRFPRIWLFFGAASFAAAWIWERLPEGVRSAGVLVAGAGFLLFVYVEVRVLLAMRKKDCDGEVEYVIVLGAKVDGYNLTDALRQRLDRALAYLNAHPGATAVVSGGQGHGEKITEARAMAEYLEEQGIAKNRILREEASTTTRENLILSGRLISGDTGKGLEELKAGIVTNDFHMYRATAIARKVGYRKVEALAAPTTPVMLVNYMVREFFGVLKMCLSEKVNSACKLKFHTED